MVYMLAIEGGIRVIFVEEKRKMSPITPKKSQICTFSSEFILPCYGGPEVSLEKKMEGLRVIRRKKMEGLKVFSERKMEFEGINF